MKKFRAPIIFSAFIYLWSLSCLAVKDTNQQLRDAIVHCEIDKVKQAIAEGADINFANYGLDSSTPLDLAIHTVAGHDTSINRYTALKILQLLINKGADIHDQGQWGQTPLMVAGDPANLLVLELLLSCGADPEDKDLEGETTLSWAQKHNSITLELLRTYPALLQKVKTQPSRALLRECIEKGYFTLVKLLLQCDITVTQDEYMLVQEKYNEMSNIVYDSMTYKIIGKLLKERLSTTTKLGLIAKKGIVGANVVSHSGDYLELTQDIAEHVGSFLPFIEKQ